MGRGGRENTGLSLPVVPVDQSPCNGCTACKHRCTAGIPLTRAEYEAMRDHLARMDAEYRDRVLAQDKELPWPGAEGEAAYTACRFFDTDTGLCAVYPARPLVCRLFGHVEWLPCPIGKIEAAWPGGPALMQTRAAEEQKTWEEWEGDSPVRAVNDPAEGPAATPSFGRDQNGALSAKEQG